MFNKYIIVYFSKQTTINKNPFTGYLLYKINLLIKMTTFVKEELTKSESQSYKY